MWSRCKVSPIVEVGPSVDNLSPRINSRIREPRNIETLKHQPKINVVSSPTSFVTVTIEDRN